MFQHRCVCVRACVCVYVCVCVCCVCYQINTPSQKHIMILKERIMHGQKK